MNPALIGDPACADEPARKGVLGTNRSALVKIAEYLGLAGHAGRPPVHTASSSFRKPVALCHSLLSGRGEVSGSRLAAEALEAYQALDERGRHRFFEALVREFSPDPEQVGEAGHAYRQAPSPENLARLQKVVEPPRQELFRRLNMAPDGTRVLVAMRGHVLDASGGAPELKAIAADLAHLFASWFNRGFLVLRRIHWRTSAEILEKLIHCPGDRIQGRQIQGWHDLRRRLEADRRCYAFFHPALPEEPILSLEIALACDLPAKAQPLLDPDTPVLDLESAEWAVFYSVTNCQDGLRGVPFGSFLMKQVMENLSQELPRIRNFATLSPVPGFRQWLVQKAPSFESIPKLAPCAEAAGGLDAPGAESQPHLLPLAAYYLLHAQRDGEPLDPVARFHLKNGARLERLNWLGDPSPAGLEHSAGLTANYIYKLADLERNQELYVREHKVRASREIEALAKRFNPPARF
jgi:malonyl-CoA decarboxylase